MLARGISVVIGTDSRGSNPDLNLWRELQFLHTNHPAVDPATLLRLGTLDGARALGFSSETGSLTVGKRADLAVAQLPENADSVDPHVLLFASEVRSFLDASFRV
jgi:cytosine/adenosine deaminase-related metal-dependent hydrolase